MNSPAACSQRGVTVAITRHAEADWQLLGALQSLAEQRKVQATVLVLDQRPSSIVETYCAENSKADVSFSYHAQPSCGISRARNTAVSLCQTELLLFTEPDARPDPCWAYWLSEPLAAGAAVAGGRILPDWRSRPPLVARSGLIMDLYSLLDLGPGYRETSKVVGCNFGINTAILGSRHAYFDENFGHSPATLMGGEEMDLCRRAAEDGLGILYVGPALVRHRIEKERTSYRWLARRLHTAGKSRARKGGAPNPTNAPGLNWATALALPLYLFYFLGFITYKFEARQAVAAKGD